MFVGQHRRNSVPTASAVGEEENGTMTRHNPQKKNLRRAFVVPCPVGYIINISLDTSCRQNYTCKRTVKRFNMEKALLQRDIVPRRARTQNGRAPPQPCDGTREMPVGVGSARPSSVGAATGAWRRLTRWTRGSTRHATRAEQCHPASLAAARQPPQPGLRDGGEGHTHCPTGTRVERR